MNSIQLLSQIKRVKRYSRAFYFLWTVIMISFLVVQYFFSINETKNIAQAIAETYINKSLDLSFWAKKNGCEYTPIF